MLGCGTKKYVFKTEERRRRKEALELNITLTVHIVYDIILILS